MSEDSARQNVGVPRPVVQDSARDGKVEVDLPATRERIVMDDEIAQQVADDIYRITEGDE